MAVVGGSNVILNPVASIGRLVGSPRLMHPVELMGILSRDSVVPLTPYSPIVVDVSYLWPHPHIHISLTKHD